MQDTAGNSIGGKGIGDTGRGTAMALDERGKRAWQDRGLDSGSAKRQLGYIVGAIVNMVLLYIVSGPLVWRIPYLTSDFVVPLAVIKLSLAASVVADLAFLAYDEAWFRHCVRLGLSAIAFVATYTLLNVFPFDFPTAMIGDAVRLGLVFALVGIVIGAVVEFFQLVFGWLRG